MNTRLATLARSTAVAILLVGGTAPAAPAAPAVEATEIRAAETQSLEPVDHIPALRRLHSWHAVDNESLIVWATAFDPYLVRLDRPSPDLKYARSIGVSEFAGRVHSRFDSIYIAGLNYRISEIYRLSRDDAKALY